MGFVPLVYLADEGLPCPRKGLCVLGGDYSIRLDAPEAQELGLFLSQSATTSFFNFKVQTSRKEAAI